MAIKKNSKVARAPVIKRFSLELANGYKDIEFVARNNIQILVAENGAGKTTLLNALYAVLTNSHKNLAAIEFSRFQLEVGALSWNKSRDDFATSDSEFAKIIVPERWTKITMFDLPIPSRPELEELIAAYADGEDVSSAKTRYFARENVTELPATYLKSLLDSIIDKKIIESFRKKREEFRKFGAEVAKALAGYSVLYLPTYRRIEASLPEYQYRPSNQTSRKHYKSSWAAEQLIHFGLHDVETKLRGMAEEIRRSTLHAFSSINAKTLDDLLFGQDKGNEKDASLIDATSLQVVLGRLGRDNPTTKERIDHLISTGEINNSNNKNLKNFLDQLMQTYASTQDKESSIESFIEAVNSYWEGDDSEKRFVFDKASAEARVVNSYTGNSLPLEALSSGEKQVVSIFARLYLDPERRTIVLIDEPELSLSMEWQQKFLPDIAHSPSCRQLIAITHSPFIFKNELRPYAESITVRRHKIEKLS